MNLNDRISKIIEYSKLSASEFADEIDVQRSSISHITSGRNKPSLDFLIKVKDRFPDLEWDWLIKNEGNMLKSENLEEQAKENSTTSLPDLFSLIDDDIYGKTEREDTIKNEPLREEDAPVYNTKNSSITDSQRLENILNTKKIQIPENQENKIKRIVLFYENGKFESFEP